MIAAIPSKYRPKLRHSLRVTISALLAFWAIHQFQVQGVWLAFSAMQVVQASVGGSVKAVFERTLGTFAGAAYGALVSMLMPHDSPVAFTFTVLLGIGPAAFLAALYPSFRIAPTTVAIVLFGEKAASLGAVHYAEDRVIEIGIGCIIGLIVSLTILPSRAHKSLAKSAGEVLEGFAVLILQLAEIAAGKEEHGTTQGKHAELRATITKMETVGDDAKRERKSRLTDDPDPDPLLRMIRRIRFDLVMIGRAVQQPLPASVAASLMSPLRQVAEQSAELFRAVAAGLPAEKIVKPAPSLDAAFGAFAGALSELHRNHALATLSENETSRVFTLSFTLEQMKQNLHDLAARASEFAEEEAEAA